MKKLLIAMAMVPALAAADQSIVYHTGQSTGLIDRNIIGKLRTNIVLSTMPGLDASYEVLPGLSLGAGYVFPNKTYQLSTGADTRVALAQKYFVEYQRGKFIARLSHTSYTLNFFRNSVGATKDYSDTWLWLGYEYKY